MATTPDPFLTDLPSLRMLSPMAKLPGRGPFIAYCVVAIVFALMMFFSASTKLTQNPATVKSIHETIGVPLSLFPVLAGLQIAGGLGLVAGILRPLIGAAAGAGFILYFIGAITAHVLAADFGGLKAPIMPFVLSVTAFWLRVASMRRVTAA